MKALADATYAYLDKLEQLEKIAGIEDKDFFYYVLQQEQAQARALNFLVEGKLEQAETVLNDFVNQHAK